MTGTWKVPKLADFLILVTVCTTLLLCRPLAAEVPVGGFLPLVGFGLSDEFSDDFLEFFAQPSPSPPPSATFLGNGGAHFDLALLDTGAAASLLTHQADIDFNIDGPYPGESDGFRGTNTVTLIGATGNIDAMVSDPLGLYVSGVQDRTASGSFSMQLNQLKGQTNYSLLTIPASSDLPNVVGLPFAGQYATSIRNDLPQIFEHNGRTVRTPHIEFHPLGSGGQGILREAPLSFNPAASFLAPPLYSISQTFDIERPYEDPAQQTVNAGGGGLFLSVDVMNENRSLNNFDFFFDTGADVTVVSRLNAVRLGFDPILDEPEFTVAVLGSGGTLQDVPGFFVEEFTIQAIGGSVTAQNVPVIVLDVTDPANPGNIVDGILGTNLLSGRNLVIDPVPALGGPVPVLYISDPVTSDFNWATTTASGAWQPGGNWDQPTSPDNLGVANIRHVSGGNQEAVLSADATVWEVNINGGNSGELMTVDIQNGAKLTTFSGINIRQDGVLHITSGSIDAQFVDIEDGTLSGSGEIFVGSGPIAGQIENRSGTVAPGANPGETGILAIEGRFSNTKNGTLDFELGGLSGGSQHDQITVDGAISLAGTLEISLIDLGQGVFNPVPGNSFTLLTSTEGVIGEFQQTMFPAGISWQVDYNSNSVVLNVLAGLPGDYDGNGVVDTADYTVWLNTLGSTTNLAADGNGNQIVDAGDWNVWRNNFGATLGSGAGAAVPEPTALLLALMAALAASVRLRPSAG